MVDFELVFLGSLPPPQVLLHLLYPAPAHEYIRLLLLFIGFAVVDLISSPIMKFAATGLDYVMV